jgi:vanillate/4-hydroxybenzoate decarboxylase subunit C
MPTENVVQLSEAAKVIAARLGNLRDFLDLLAEHGQMVHWTDPVLPESDIRNVSVAAGNDVAGGPAVLFDKVHGYPGHRVATNVLGSFANLAVLLGFPKTATVREMFFEMVHRWGSDKPLLDRVPREQAPVFENHVDRDINLYKLLPLHRINEFDGGFYIAKACIVTRDPLEPENFGKQNVGIYRIQVMGPDTVTILSIPAHDGGRQMMAAEAHDKPLRAAIMIGNHPAMTLFGGTPVGYDESEFAYASQILGSRLRLTHAHNGADILADSEMVIEADMVLNGRETEGPFGEFPGSYSGVRKVPLFKVTSVSHRHNPIFENIYIGRGWTEHDTLIGLPTSLPIYAALKKDFPEVQAVNAMYQHGLTAIISVRNRMSGFAKSVAMRALGTPHGVMYLKNIILVDDFVDPFDLNEVMWALSTRTRANDIIVLPNMPMVPIDPAAEVPGKGHRLIIDATSFMAPDNLGADPHLVTRPGGPEIEEMMRRLRTMQDQGGQRD